MKTVVKNWSLVTIDDFQIVWAVVVTDTSCRFNPDHFVCSSRIISFNGNQPVTKSGSTYELIGPGTEYTASYKQLVLLRSGKSPAELKLKLKGEAH
jgi:hypothetical protein